MQPINVGIAKLLIKKHHYLHSLPGGTKLSFGVFSDRRLLGAVTLGVGPTNAHRLVRGAAADDGITLTRLWLSDELPPNSESRVIGIVLRSLQRHTKLKFILSYADPSQGHLGTIYQSTNWLYIGLSSAMPLYDIGDGVARHSRSLAHAYGSHSVRHFTEHGVNVKRIAQARKHRYIYFIDSAWRERLAVPVLPYPKKEGTCEDH